MEIINTGDNEGKLTLAISQGKGKNSVTVENKLLKYSNISLFRLLKVFLLYFSSFIFCYHLFALDPELAITQYVIDTWTVDDGLPQNTPTCIIQTHDGYLWIGTGNGVARFDGVKFTVFSMYNTPELRGHNIRQLVEDHDKNLWIRTDQAINLYKNGQFKSFLWQEGWNYNPRENEFFLDENGEPCVLNLNKNNLLRFRNGRFENIYKTTDVFDNINRIFVDEWGNAFFLTNSGVKRFRNNKPEIVKGTEGLKVNHIFKDEQGKLGLVLKNVLVKVKNGRLESFKFKIDLIDNNSISRIIEDRNGTLWMRSSKGLYRYWQGNLELIKKENGLADSYVLTMYEDRDGNLWVGTKLGLSRIKDPRVTTYSTEEGLGCNFPRSIYQDRQGSIWIGGDCVNNLTRIVNGKFKVYSKQKGLSEDSGIGSFYEDKDGTLWLGGRLSKFNKSKFEPFKTRKGKYIENIRAICEDEAGSLWIGTNDGLILLEDKDINVFTTENGLSYNQVWEFMKDQDNTLWIGTAKGLTLYKNGIFQIVRDAGGLSQKAVMEIYMDNEETVWLGTYGGLYRYRNGHFFLYTMKDGLVDDAILGILEDDKNNLWMSSNHGIFYVNKKALHDFAAGRIEALHPASFDRTDGMKLEECNGSGYPSCWKTREGRLWFPTMKGVVVVDPNRLKLNTQPPPVYIEKVLLEGKPVVLNGSVNVMPGTQRIEFHYTAVNFHNPQKVRFRFKLEGYDKQWAEPDPGEERIAHYMNVPGGEYSFKVIACNNDGFWNKRGASIALKVIPPFHQTWWFKTFGLLIFGAVFYLLISFIRKYFYLFAFWKKKSHIGQYVIVKLIGCGAVAEVFKAHHLLKKKKTVAVKILKREYAAREISKKRFKQEGAIIDRLEHPNIIKIYERGRQEDDFYIVMEYLEGQTLTERIKEENRIKTPDFLEIMRQLAGVLSVLHDKNIMHRDLKPSNIMLIERDGTRNFVKLLDFGLARSLYQTRMTESGSLLGTIHYIPPEQITHSIFSPAGDIYALGMIGYEMLTGMIPFEGSTDLEIIGMKLNKQPAAPVIIQPDIPPAFNKLIMQMIARDFKTRPTAGKIVSKLKTFN